MMQLWPAGHPPFRAGAVPGARPGYQPGAYGIPQARGGAQPLPPGRVLLADISQFQPDIADAAYLRWSQAIVIRAMYGAAMDDGAWYGGTRRAALHAGGCRFLGLYQYLTAFQDAAQQAQALVRMLGPLRPGEIPICDLEEGAGGQQGRWQAWQRVMLDAYPQLRATPLGRPLLYSGLDFAAAAGLDPDWVAAYQPLPPPGTYLLWQFTDSAAIPGVGVADCSIFDGTISDLVTLISPATAQEDDMPNGKTLNLTGPTVIVVPAGADSITFAAVFGSPSGNWPDGKISYNASGGPYDVTHPIPGSGEAVTIPITPGVRKLCVWNTGGTQIAWDF
jgi:hypothetical protein